MTFEMWRRLNLERKMFPWMVDRIRVSHSDWNGMDIEAEARCLAQESADSILGKKLTFTEWHAMWCEAWGVDINDI